MSLITEGLPSHAITIDPIEVDTAHVLALVQGDLVISTYPEQQVDAAIDLARVLCRALAQPVDVFRIRHFGTHDVQAGAQSDSGAPEWMRLAHVRLTFLSGVEVDMYDRHVR